MKNFFHTQSSLPFVIFGAALPFSMLQAVERSAVTGLDSKEDISKKMRTELLAFVAPVLVSQLGQILINNSDVILVKRFFETSEAGKYAALALIGRIVFFATWSVVTTMFPIVAQKQKMGEPHEHLLWVSLGIVAGVSVPIVLLTLFAPQWVVTILFGKKYLEIASLLWLYALATSLYAMANVVINYRLSLGMGRETGFAIAAGIAQVLGIIYFHNSLAQVVYVQVIVMAALFLSLMWHNFLHEKAAIFIRKMLRYA